LTWATASKQVIRPRRCRAGRRAYQALPIIAR
jgi:hypothetical protein